MNSKLKRLGCAVVLVTAIVMAVAAPAFAADAPKPVYQTPAVAPGDVAVSLNLLWVILGAVLVIFMQAGFALVETGFCRAKHAAHVVSTNFAIFGLGFVGFFLVGYGLMFGGFSFPGVFGLDAATGGPLAGSGHWVFLWHGGFALTNLHGLKNAAPAAAMFLYMVAFMDTTATIPTGSMAERWKWKAFVGWGLFCGALYYPIFGGWTWGGGWLSQLGNNIDLGFGYTDFAGSGVVHAMGGIAGLAGALILGARIGKFGADGKPKTLAAHNIPMAMLGTFILLFGWFGFNAASTLAATDLRFTVVAVNTAIAAAFGATIAMFYCMKRMGKPDPGMMANGMLAGLVAITAPCAFVQPWAAAVIGSIAAAFGATAAMFYCMKRMGKPDPGMMANGMLAGLVAITAPCAFVQPWAAAVIGILAAVIVVESVFFFERKGIDDPVGAISVHGVNGAWGVLSLGLFADGKYGDGWNGVPGTVTGLFYGDSKQFFAQCIGTLTCFVFVFVSFYVFFKLLDKILGNRVSKETEIAGLDLPEMGALAYPEFELAPGSGGSYIES